MNNHIWMPDVLCAGVVIVLFSYIGFSVPSWSRTYTTALRYYLALAVQAAFYLFVFLLMYAIFQRGLTHYMGGRPAATELAPLSVVWPAFLAALCLCKLPLLSSRPRIWLRRMACIPAKAHAVTRRLQEAELMFAPEIGKDARVVLLNRGIDVDDKWLPPAEPAHKLLLKATSLFIQVRRWENDRHFKRFLGEAGNDFDLLRHRFDQISFRVARMLASIERLGEIRSLMPGKSGESANESDRVDALLRTIIGNMVTDACEEIGIFYHDICLIVARAALTNRSTSQGRYALLRSLGFVLPRRDPPAGYRVLAYGAALLAIGIWIFLLVLPAAVAQIGPRALEAVITLIVIGSLSIAIVPKLHWGFANAGLHAKTPVGFVVGAGICAAIFAAVVNLAAGAILVGGWPGALERLREGAPYFPLPAILSATIAWLIQDHRWLAVSSPQSRRLRDAATLATTWMLGAIATRVLLHMFGIPQSAGPTAVFALGMFVFGSVIGYFTPESIRVDDMRAVYRVTTGSTRPARTEVNEQPAV